MHEFNVCQKIVDSAVAELERMEPKPQRLAKVTVAVGRFRQLDPKHLAAAYRSLAKGTRAEGSSLEIISLPVVGRCRGCGCEYDLDENSNHCPECQGTVAQIIKGRELYIDSLEVEHDPPPHEM
jgi:hydrogenase nickel incorporation protein HypA/HybF